MGKTIGVSEFKAKCLALLDEMERTGEPLTITRRGKPTLTLVAKRETEERGSAFGFLKSDAYRYAADPSEPAVDSAIWDANNPAELYDRS